MSGFMKLYVDDERPLPDIYDSHEWTTARSFHEAIVKLELINFDEVSLDHDIASFYGNKELTGYDILMWLCQRKYEGMYHVPAKIHIHTANPVGRDNMQALLDQYFPENQ